MLGSRVQSTARISSVAHISLVLALISSHTSLSEIASAGGTLSAADGGGGGNFRSSGLSGGSLPYVTLCFVRNTCTYTPR